MAQSWCFLIRIGAVHPRTAHLAVVVMAGRLQKVTINVKEKESDDSAPRHVRAWLDSIPLTGTTERASKLVDRPRPLSPAVLVPDGLGLVQCRGQDQGGLLSRRWGAVSYTAGRAEEGGVDLARMNESLFIDERSLHYPHGA